jgi:hypothetical protein
VVTTPSRTVSSNKNGASGVRAFSARRRKHARCCRSDGLRARSRLPREYLRWLSRELSPSSAGPAGSGIRQVLEVVDDALQLLLVCALHLVSDSFARFTSSGVAFECFVPVEALRNVRSGLNQAIRRVVEHTGLLSSSSPCKPAAVDGRRSSPPPCRPAWIAPSSSPIRLRNGDGLWGPMP